MADSLNQAAFFAALSVHINAHPDVPELASVSWAGLLHVPGTAGITGALTWARTLGGEVVVRLGSHGNGETGIEIRGTVAGHDVAVFTVDHGRLSELLPADVGQPYYERNTTITLTELESYLAAADAPVSKPIPASAPGAENTSLAQEPPAEGSEA